MSRELYAGQSCPGEPTMTMSEWYDQRADGLLAGEAPWYSGHSVLHDRAHAAKLRREHRDIPFPRHDFVVSLHMDGPRDHTMVCPCGHWADFLCDTPIGRGKTCDRPMCYCCREQVGDDLDRCPYHRATTT